MRRLPPNYAALIAGLAACLLHGAASAQPVQQVSLSAEVETDRRERGLGWSDGKVAASVSAYVPVTDRLSLDVEAANLRDSARHDGADLAITAAPRLALTQSAWNLSVGVRGHLFVGRSGLHYMEVTGDLDHTIGPIRLGLGAAFAPSQSAIGGENLYLAGRAESGIPGTPLTVYGGAGHTSGPDRRAGAARLRPGGDYFDYHLGVEYSRAVLALGVRYSDTSIARRAVDRTSAYYDRHYGARLVAYIRITP